MSCNPTHSTKMCLTEIGSLQHSQVGGSSLQHYAWVSYPVVEDDQWPFLPLESTQTLSPRLCALYKQPTQKCFASFVRYVLSYRNCSISQLHAASHLRLFSHVTLCLIHVPSDSCLKISRITTSCRILCHFCTSQLRLVDFRRVLKYAPECFEVLLTYCAVLFIIIERHSSTSKHPGAYFRTCPLLYCTVWCLNEYMSIWSRMAVDFAIIWSTVTIPQAQFTQFLQTATKAEFSL